jgi:hypothetical protein
MRTLMEASQRQAYSQGMREKLFFAIYLISCAIATCGWLWLIFNLAQWALD